MRRTTYAALAATVLFTPARADVSLRGVTPELAAKVAAIKSVCSGTRVISAVRHTRIRGSRRMSLHASGRAVDLAGNPACIYSQLQGWPGGYSTDYARVRHVHISLGGFEDGVRFAHYTGRKAKRYARSAPRTRYVTAVRMENW